MSSPAASRFSIRAVLREIDISWKGLSVLGVLVTGTAGGTLSVAKYVDLPTRVGAIERSMATNTDELRALTRLARQQRCMTLATIEHTNPLRCLGESDAAGDVTPVAYRHAPVVVEARR